METLKNAVIHGKRKHVAAIKRIFGSVRFRSLDHSQKKIEFSIVAVVPNHYMTPYPERDNAWLYILVPNVCIHTVWPKVNEFADGRFGTATQAGDDQKPICSAIAIDKGRDTLYFCLDSRGHELTGMEDLDI